MKAALLFALLVARSGFAAAPTVAKVEPPDWPVEPNGITLRMLITGRDLSAAAVRCRFRCGPATVSPSGTHLFVDLTIPAKAAPGDYPIEIATAAGTVKAPFTIVPALAPAGRFQGFSSDDVVYLIMPDRFANGDPSNDDPSVSQGLHDRTKARYYHGGDFAGIIQHLPYLKDLGVTALWLTPIYDNANRLNQRETYDNQAITDYHGYGAVDFYRTEEHFGTLDEFRSLVDQAHALGIRIIQDQVANHTGPYHPWVQDPPTPTWLNGSEARHLANTWQTWTLIDPHATPAMRKSTLEGWFVNILPDLNQNDPEVSRYLIQNTLWWIGRTGIDGIRQDTLPYAPRRFWHDWSGAIKQRYPKFNIVGEVFDGDPALVSFFQGGRAQFDGIDSGIDTLFDFPLHYAVRKVFTGGGPPRELAQTLAHDFLYRDANRLVTFVDLHDVARFLSLPGGTPAELARVFAFLLTARGIPLIYYGDEVAMEGQNDPDNRRDFPGGWKEDARNAFEPAGRTAPQQELWESLRKLTRLRAASDPLRRGSLVDLLVDDNTYAFARVLPGSQAVVVFNNAAQEVTLRIPLAGSGVRDGASLEDALGHAPPLRAQNGTGEVRLPARSVAIYR